MNSPNRFPSIRVFACFAFLSGIVSLAVSSQEIEPKPLKKVIPVYPEELRRLGISGVARLKVVIAPDGSVKEVEVLGGSAIMAESASKAVKQWRYPASEKPQRVAVISVEFECCSTVKIAP